MVGARWQYPAVPASVPEIRRRAADVLHGHVPDAQVEDCQLVLDELVSSSVSAGASTVQVELQLMRSAVRIWVEDDGADVPTQRTGPDPDMTGRGLRVVAALSARWGTTHSATGRTTLWAVMPPIAPAKPPAKRPAKQPANGPRRPRAR